METDEDVIPSLENSESYAQSTSDQVELGNEQLSSEKETEIQSNQEPDVSISLAAMVKPCSLPPSISASYSSSQVLQDFYLSSAMVQYA